MFSNHNGIKVEISNSKIPRKKTLKFEIKKLLEIYRKKEKIF